MNSIIWPQGYIPGFSDNFASNEMIITGVSVEALWDKLTDTAAWPGYYSNASDIRFYDGTGPRLTDGARFRFTTFGFQVEAEVNEFEPPLAGRAGRIAWHGWCGDDSESRLDARRCVLPAPPAAAQIRLLRPQPGNQRW